MRYNKLRYHPANKSTTQKHDNHDNYFPKKVHFGLQLCGLNKLTIANAVHTRFLDFDSNSPLCLDGGNILVELSTSLAPFRCLFFDFSALITALNTFVTSAILSQKLRGLLQHF